MTDQKGRKVIEDAAEVGGLTADAKKSMKVHCEEVIPREAAL